MKFTQAIILSALAATGLGSPTAKGISLMNAHELETRAATVAMTFVGQAVVGGPNVTLSGTAESIYNQLLAINPEYNPWDFSDYAGRMESLGINRADVEAGVEATTAAVAKRSLNKRDWFNCDIPRDRVGNFYTQCIEGTSYLQRINGYCGLPAGWGGCARVSCSTNCAIWACNDNPYPISVWCGNLAGDAYDIAGTCGQTYSSGSGYSVTVTKGQVFRDASPKWNTIVQSDSC